MAGGALAALLTAAVVIAAVPYKPGVIVECIQSDEERERLKNLSTAALDAAYQDHVQHLYAVWLRDARDQPKRAQAGITKALAAWLDARRGVGAFTPPECK